MYKMTIGDKVKLNAPVTVEVMKKNGIYLLVEGQLIVTGSIIDTDLIQLNNVLYVEAKWLCVIPKK